jgi:tetratricopeptide (TPR) repeat protein
MTLFTMGRKPLVGIATFGILTAIGFGTFLYVFLSTFALGSTGVASDRSIEIGAFAFLVVAIVSILNVKKSGKAFVYVFMGYRAIRLLRTKRFAESQIRFARMVTKYPNDVYAWYGQAQALLGLHRNIEALASCEKALAAASAKPTSVSWLVQLWLFKGGILYFLHRFSNSLGALEQSLALDPNYPPALAQKAYILQRIGYQEQALATAEHALNGVDIASTKTWHGMAMVAKAGALNGIGRHSEALDIAKKAALLAQQSSTIWIIQADALAHLGHLQEARIAANQGLAKVEQQIADFPERGEYWENRASLLGILGRTSEAEDAEKQASALIEKSTSTVMLPSSN